MTYWWSLIEIWLIKPNKVASGNLWAWQVNCANTDDDGPGLAYRPDEQQITIVQIKKNMLPLDDKEPRRASWLYSCCRTLYRRLDSGRTEVDTAPGRYTRYRPSHSRHVDTKFCSCPAPPLNNVTLNISRWLLQLLTNYRPVSPSLVVVSSWSGIFNFSFIRHYYQTMIYIKFATIN